MNAPIKSIRIDGFAVNARNIIDALRDGDLSREEAIEWVDKLIRFNIKPPAQLEPVRERRLSEEACFMVEAALEAGFKITNDDGTEFAATEHQIVALVTMVTRNRRIGCKHEFHFFGDEIKHRRCDMLETSLLNYGVSAYAEAMRAARVEPTTDDELNGGTTEWKDPVCPKNHGHPHDFSLREDGRCCHCGYDPEAAPIDAELNRVAQILEGYADSYDRMGRIGDGNVRCNSVATDIRQNMITATKRKTP